MTFTKFRPLSKFDNYFLAGRALYIHQMNKQIKMPHQYRASDNFLSSFIAYPLERCCVHNAPPVVTNSCLPPGRCKANVLLAKVCLDCTTPGWCAKVFLTVAFNREAAASGSPQRYGGGPLSELRAI